MRRVSGRRRARRKKTLIWLTVLFLFASLFAAVEFRESTIESSKRHRSPRGAPAWANHEDYAFLVPEGEYSGRAIYPYSVIPGGVRNRSELLRAVYRDPVVAKHFAYFELPDAEIAELRREQYVHVSYRVQNQIYWTRKKIRLPRGEKLITDGRDFARTRCGNRVSVLAQGPTLPEEPPIEALETPMIAEIQPELALNEFPLPLPAVFPPPMTPAVAIQGLELPVIPPSIPIIPPTRFEPPIIIVPPGVTPSPQSEIPAVPEPGTLLLLGSGLVAAFLLRKSLKK